MKKYILIFSLYGLFFAPIWAQSVPSRVPARRDPIVRTMPDGDTITILLRGDERSHRTMTLDGWQIRENNEGYFVYVKQKKGGDLVNTNKRAHNVGTRSCCEKRWLNRNGILIRVMK